MKAQCKKCGKWFPITKELEELIIEGIIYAPDINLCSECAEIEAEEAEYLHELQCIINEY